MYGPTSGWKHNKKEKSHTHNPADSPHAMHSIEYTIKVDAKQFVTELLAKSKLSKTELSSRSGVSRALIDDYLKGRKQPTVGQLNRLVKAANMAAELKVHPKPRPLPQAFVEVLELGELFESAKPREPLPDLSKTWRGAA